MKKQSKTTQSADGFDRFDPKKRNMLRALVKTHGIVGEAARKAGIHRSTHSNWCNTNHELFDKDYKHEVDAINESALDFTESKLFECIKDGNVTAIIWHLKTKGKKRGYIEKQLIGFDDDEDEEISSTLAI